MNDYQAPVEDIASGENAVCGEEKKKLPVFVKTIAIIDLVLSCFRIIFLPMSIIGFILMTADDLCSDSYSLQHFSCENRVGWK